MRIKYEDMLNEFKRILITRGYNEEDAYECAKNFTDNSRDGVYSHGVNRFERVIEYIDKGYIDITKKPTKIDGIGAIERWDGNLGMGNLNAKIAMNRAIELSKEFGVGVVALKNTNHWMRGGTFGWQAADAGCIGICWTNTIPNMAAWGARDPRLGNNPFVMAIPRSNGKHVVVDMAMSQFSYGKIEEYRLKGSQLPIPGGYDSEDKLTTDPSEIEKTGRILPTGYWKGSSMSLALDLIATVLSGGNSTLEIGKNGKYEYSISQVLIAMDPSHFNTVEMIDDIVNTIVNDIKDSEPETGGKEVLYPGERMIKTRSDNMKNGIPVNESIWSKIIAL